MQDAQLELTQTWDKVFPKSELVDHEKVTFHNHCDLYDGGEGDYIPFDKLQSFFEQNLA